jgi:hypothetical protein
MASGIDAILRDVEDISRRLARDDLSARDRRALENERDRLRSQARELADERRHPDSIRAEIEMLEARLAEIDDLLIGKGYSEKWFKQTIQDPSAYSHTINAALREQHAGEVDEITERLTRLRALLLASNDRSETGA